MQKFNFVNRLILLFLGVSILLFVVSCFYSMTSLRLMNGDGSRVMLNLLGNPHVYVEPPYFRLSNVLLQWPYLIIANLVNLKINEARIWIAFSYSSMPIFFFLFYGIQSFRLKNIRWFWATIGLTSIVYLPQAFNAFNTVVESSFLFLLYLFIEKKSSGYIKNIFLPLLIVSFVCSHEISLAYTGFIFAKPTVDNFLANRKISLKIDWISLLGLLGSIAILFRYFRLPEVDHVDFKSHFLSYTENPYLPVTLLFMLLCYLVSARKRILTIVVSVIFILVLVKASLNLQSIEFFHYTYRLITPFVTLGWCLLVYYRTNFLDSKIVQVFLLIMFALFSVKDLEISEKWTVNLNNFLKFTQNKPICYTENDEGIMNYLRQYGYFDRVIGLHISLTMSPSYGTPQLIFLPTSESAVFDPCKHIGDFRIPYTENGYHHFYYNKLSKFNWRVLDSLKAR